jgi:Ca2+-binding RTX toxin-like protein
VRKLKYLIPLLPVAVALWLVAPVHGAEVDCATAGSPYCEALPDGTTVVRGLNGQRNVLIGNPNTPNIIYGGDQADDITCGNRGDLAIADGGNDDVKCGSGDDRISGGDGADTIKAGSGDDRVRAGSGDDVIQGGNGDDVIFGQGGNDSINPGRGKDRVSGGSGTDTINTVDGEADSVVCDGGNDRVVADEKDAVNGDCDRVTIR